MAVRAYLENFEILSDNQEIDFLKKHNSFLYDSVYPYKIFPDKGLRELDFAPITIFYGSNGSGKTTLLNVIAEKIGAQRSSPFSGSPHFAGYVEQCEASGRLPRTRRILASDDVFESLLDTRLLNNGIDTRREELLYEYAVRNDPEADVRLHSLAEYEDWKVTYDARTKSSAGFVRPRLMRNTDMKSNGESALRYFAENITEHGVFLLDEPENSLSITYQKELADFLYASVRGYGCQIILSTHSPILLSMEGALIYDLDEYPVSTKPWTQLDNVRAYFDFFMQHQEEF